MKHLTLAAALLAATAVAPTAFAQDSELSVTTGVDYVTEYVFRGTSLAGAAVQPYAEATYGDFTVGGWFSTGVGESSIIAGDEFDLYVGYSVPLDSTISLDIGATYFHFPQFGSFFSSSESTLTDFDGEALLDEDGNELRGPRAGTYEVSASLGFNEVPLAPSITGYYDFTLNAFTIEGSLGHSIPFGESQSFDLGATGGYVNGEDGFDYTWVTGTASVSHSFTDDVSMYVGANYSLNSDDLLGFNINDIDPVTGGLDQDGGQFWVGTGISAGF